MAGSESLAGTLADVVVRGPGSPFTLLFDDARDDGEALPGPFAAVYPGSWRLPAPGPLPYLYSNFVLSRDGRASFAEAGRSTGADVSGFDPHDRWLMGLLRARADAVLMGANTLRVEPEHLWTAEFVAPEDAAALGALRRHERRSASPLQVFLSAGCDVDVGAAAVFSDAALHVVLATTERGARRARSLPATAARLDVLALGGESVDVRALLERLRDDYGVATVLTEGGPRAYASMLAAGCVTEEFLALSPLVVGSSPAAPRPGLVEGVSFPAGAAPRSRPLTAHRAGDLLFLRSRLEYPSD